MGSKMAKNATTKSKPQNKRLAIFLDGTWNDAGDNTNVWRTKSLCAPIGSDECEQISYYDRGVNGFWGGTFGKGLINNVVEAYEWLVEHYRSGDDIFIFGFSRGAFTARSLAGFIAKYGLVRPGSPLGVGQLYERYQRAADATIWALHANQNKGTLTDPSLEERWMLKHSMPINIKMIAVWDTVGALGIPVFSIPGISRSTLKFLHTGLRVPIEHGFHALAIDEHRASFQPTLWTVKKTTQAKPRPLESVEQRWFVGAHANIGGGYHSDLLAQRPLWWILSKAEKLGLKFRGQVNLDDELYNAGFADSYSSFLGGWYKAISGRHHRSIGLIERTIDDSPSETVNETIDSSVFERWRRDEKYRPPSLDDWAKRHSVDLGSIRNSVRADDPKRSVPD